MGQPATAKRLKVHLSPTPKLVLLALEAASYAEWSKKMQETVGNGTPEFNEASWQKRIENADRVDRGQLSPEVAAVLNESYRKQTQSAHAATDRRHSSAA